jgi:hypothetical protein
MAKPERGGASEEQHLSPGQRIQEAAGRIKKGEEEAREIGKNLGIAIKIAAEVEALTQFAEKDPFSSEAKEIKGAFLEYEGTLTRVREKEESLAALRDLMALSKEIVAEEEKDEPNHIRLNSLRLEREAKERYKFLEDWWGGERQWTTEKGKIQVFRMGLETMYKELEDWQRKQAKEEEKIRDLAKRILPPH